MQVQIRDGKNTKFWTNRWLETGILKSIFRRFYALESMKDASVNCRMGADIDSWSMRHPVQDGFERKEAISLKEVVDGLSYEL